MCDIKVTRGLERSSGDTHTQAHSGLERPSGDAHTQAHPLPQTRPPQSLARLVVPHPPPTSPPPFPLPIHSFIHSGHVVRRFVESTTVEFDALSTAAIEAYLGTNEPFGKAGGCGRDRKKKNAICVWLAGMRLAASDLTRPTHTCLPAPPSSATAFRAWRAALSNAWTAATTTSWGSRSTPSLARWQCSLRKGTWR